MLGEYRITGRGGAEIAASVEQGIAEGALAPGRHLPPMRELARELGVNPNTVAAAYRTLRERGVIETAGRRGSRVRARPASTPREELRVDVPEGTVDLSTGNPDPALLPPLDEALAAAARRAAAEPTVYGSPPLVPRFARLARAALESDGVPEAPLAATSGSLDAIERVLSAHLRPGDRVAVEDPGWGSLLDLVPALGLRPVPMALDDEGPTLRSAERALASGARALVVTARAQNPTGAAVSEERAARLRELLATRPTTLLVEDDHGHGIAGLPHHPLAGATAHWALVRSTSKAYGPDLRVAVLTGDDTTLARVAGRQRLGPGWVSRLLQHAVVHLWETDAVDGRAVAHSYDRRREELRGLLAARGIETRGRSGMNLWLPVPDETGAVARLLHAGWAVAPGARFRTSSAPGVRLTVSPLTRASLEPLADAVAVALRPSAGGRYD